MMRSPIRFVHGLVFIGTKYEQAGLMLYCDEIDILCSVAEKQVDRNTL